MAAANTRVRLSMDAVTFDSEAKSKKKMTQASKYLVSYAGSVCYMENDQGIIQARMNGSLSYVYFIFSNVFCVSCSTLPIDPTTIEIGKVFNFHIVNISIPLINNKKCFHAGLLWKVSKPKVKEVAVDPACALSLLKKFLLNDPSRKDPMPKFVPVVIPPAPKEKRLLNLSGHNPLGTMKSASGFLWRAINANEGLMIQRREKGSIVTWFNKSNLEKLKTKFTSVHELYGIPLHYDAELLYLPSNPNDYIWYQGTVFWDSGTPKPNVPNGLVGSKIFDYKPTSEFSLLLKERLELQRTGQFDLSKLDNVFRELTKTKIFTESPQKPQVQPNKVDQVKAESSRRSSLPDSSAIQVPATSNWRASMSNLSSSNDVANKKSGSSFGWKEKKETNFFQGAPILLQPGAVLVPPVLMQPKNVEANWLEIRKLDGVRAAAATATPIQASQEEEKINRITVKLIRENSCFQTPLGHFLSIKETKSVPDYFSRALDFKAIFSIKNVGTEDDTIATRLPEAIEHWITTSHKEPDGMKSEREKRNSYASCLPHDVIENLKAYFSCELPTSKYMLKLNGSIVHLSEELKCGLIYCKYGFVFFDFENFYDFDKSTNDWKQEKGIISLREVLFDAIPEKGNGYKFVATCVWIEKRPDIQALITSVAKVPDKLKPGKYSGKVVKLDLPSNAIVKLIDEDVGVVVTRSIFDPNKTNNIAEYLAVGQEILVTIEKSNDYFYAQNAVRYERPQFELEPDKNIKGYGVITNYSHHAGIFQFRGGNKIHNAIFSKDLAKYFDDDGIARYFPIGNCIYFKGYDMRLAMCEISVIANVIKRSRVLKENEELWKEIDQTEFISKKIYTGTVKEIRRPYAFVLECTNEERAKVKVFVSLRKFAPSKGEMNLTYCDQIQHHVKINDSVAFIPEMCSNTDLHPFTWHAAQAWKVKNEVFCRTSRQSSSGKETEGSITGDSFMTACSDSQDEPISDSEISEAISNLRLGSCKNDKKETILKNILRDVIKDERFFPDTVINRIVDNYFKRLKSTSRVKDLKKLVENSVPQSGSSKVETISQGAQTLSTGKVLYLKISPS